MKALVAHAALFGLVLLRHVGFAPHVHSTATAPLTDSVIAQLWVAPDDLQKRNLFDGPWGRELAPNPDATYTYLSTHNGFSPGFDVRGPDDSEWSVKLGDEAQPEVVASRILSAIGYHQPPVYYL